MLFFIFLIALAIPYAYLLARYSKQYTDYITSLDKKAYPFKAVIPLGLYILDKFNYKYNNRYDKSMLDKYAELNGVKYSSYYLRIHMANKLSITITGLLMVLFVSGVISIQDSGTVNPQSLILENGSKIQRPSFGEGDRNVELNANIKRGSAETTESFTVPVKEMPPVTEDEKAVSAASQKLTPELIKGDNKSLSTVVKPLKLPVDDKDFGGTGVRIKWKTGDVKILKPDGNITRPEYGSGDRKVALNAYLQRGSSKQLVKRFVVVVVQSETPKTDQQFVLAAKNFLMNAFGSKDKLVDIGNKIELPKEIKSLGGAKIRWFPVEGEKDYTPLFIVVFGLALIIGVTFAFDSDIKKKIEKRRLLLRLDFPDFLNKLVLLLNAGMTFSKAWEKAYIEEKKDRPIYQEIYTVIMEIKAGKPEAQAYDDFAIRCRIPEISKFISIAQQNLRKGNSDMARVLRLQAMECWEVRKNAAKRLGEEASTRMLLPLMIMLIAILAIVATPAVLAINGM